MKSQACLILWFLVAPAVFSQTDSLLKKANEELYEHPDRAIRIGLGITKSEQASLTQKTDALIVISTAYSSTRNYAKSLEYAVLAAQQLPQINDDGFKVNAYTRLGVQYQQLQVFNKAHWYLDKAIAVAKNSKQSFDSHKMLGFNYAIRGLVYKQQMSCDIALDYFNKSLYEHQHTNDKGLNYANMSVIVYNKGNCFLSLGKIDSARSCYASAYIYADKIDANSLKAFANKGLAEVKTHEKQYTAAIALLLSAEKESAEVGDQVLNQGIYKGLSDNYLLLDDLGKYEHYLQKYRKTTKQIEQTNVKTLDKFIAQLDDETDAEVKSAKSDALYFQVPLAAIACLAVVILFAEIRRSKRKLHELSLQRARLEANAERM